MPIVYKGLSGVELLGMLAIPVEDCEWLEAHGFLVTVYATEIRFSGMDIAAAIPCKVDHLTQLKQGSLGELATKALRMGVLGAIKQLRKKVEGGAGTVPPPTTAAPDAKPAAAPAMASGGVMAMLAKNKAAPASAPAAAPAAPSPAWPQFPLAQLTKATPIQLAQATQMYQPVRGSSPGTRYFLVGATAGLRIACRYKATSLSVRIEGSGLADNTNRLEACGFTGLHASYASMHLTVTDPMVARKALGAVLLGLGLELQTPLPDLGLLTDKGN